jgi:hypothetical protein
MSGCSGLASIHTATRGHTSRAALAGSHKAAYKCNWRVTEKQHLLDRITRCHNPEVATHLLEAKVLQMIRDTLLVPERLIACMEGLEGGIEDCHQAKVDWIDSHGKYDWYGLRCRLGGRCRRAARCEDRRRPSAYQITGKRRQPLCMAVCDVVLDRHVPTF